MKIAVSKFVLWAAIFWAVFMILFWFVGDIKTMSQYAAFFGVNGLYLVYGFVLWIAHKILVKPKKL